ncbi:MAG TPA: ABC transporter permease [Ideonella sp.]|uniref:ABC transporter permease n=1 Tax=Ideonella sp. TaxID=1929293 RepID=UPI002E34267A|nr:ABC transporter permease [Ideonella sp.]HEX5688330.1 ABC transporter permease [Ideonella sp.]
MLAYYFDLALRSFKSARGLSLLMVIALGLGIGACMTTLTVYRVLSGDPIPSKSARLFDVELDSASMVGYQPGEEPTFQLTRFDAEALLRAKRAKRQAMMSGANVPVQPDSASIKPFYAAARYTSADFFAMFETPFLFGGSWDAQADEAQARIAVISRELNDKLFGGENSVGRELRVRSVAMRVVGVLNDWRPVPHFYDMTMGMTEYEQVLLPFSTAMGLKFGTSGNTNCWGNTGGASPRDLNAPCSWVQYWVELESPGDAAAFRDYLVQYSEEQRRAGRFERPANVRLRNVTDWLAHRKVLPGDVRLQVWLAFGFLLVCLTNTVGLLLAKCLRRSAEIGVRRALGATKRAIFAQFLVEAGTLGLAGGLLGLLLAVLGLWLVRHSPADYAPLVQMDWPMLALTLLLALAASVIAGLLPAWRAANVTPAQQLKTQ